MEDYSWTTGGNVWISHERLIARGGFGEVHLMRSSPDHELFARKTIHPWGHVRKCDIENEVRALTTLQKAGKHRNVVHIFHHGWLGVSSNSPAFFYAIDMEFCELSLDQYIYGDRVLDEHSNIDASEKAPVFVKKDRSIFGRLENVWTIMQHIASGIEFMHKHKQVHRDLKPRNSTFPIHRLLINTVLYSNRKNVWKIIDFGCTAEVTSGNARTSGECRGTRGYRPPELLLEPGRYTNRSDIWAMGCILYELIVWRKAFKSDWQVSEYFREESVIKLPDGCLGYEQYATPDPFVYMRPHFNLALRELLARDWEKRPSASETHRLFYSYCKLMRLGLLTIPAAEKWRHLLQTCGSEEEFMMQLGEVYATQEDFRTAIKIWSLVLVNFPNQHRTRIRLADAYMRIYDYKAVIELLKGTLEDRNIQSFREEIEYNRIEIPATRLEALLDNQRMLRSMQSQLADAYSKAGMVDEAIGVWSSLLPNRADREVINNLTQVYNKTGREEAALTLLEGLVNGERSDRNVLAETGALYQKKEDFANAISLWVRALDTDIGSHRLLDELIETFDRHGRADAVATVLTERVHDENLNWGLQVRIIRAYKEMHNYGAAALFSKKILQRHSDEAAWFKYKLGDVYRLTRDLEIHGAWGELVKAHESQKERIRKELVDIYSKQSDLDFAIAGWEELADVEPTSWFYQNELAMAYKQKGDIDTAIQGWWRLIDRHPQEAWWFEDQLAKTYATKGDDEQAAAGWKELYKRHPIEGWRLKHRFSGD